jgi:hypothetical protein
MIQRMARSLLPLFFLLGVFSGCASSSPYMLPESDGASQAPGAAFTADGMNFRKEMPDHRNDRSWEFYYKHCSPEDGKFFFSKTDAYSCSDPF